METFHIIGFLLLVVSIMAKDHSLIPANSIATPKPRGAEMRSISERDLIKCSHAESTIKPDFRFLAGLFCSNLRSSDAKMGELYEWTYILNKAEHIFSILFQSGCYSRPDIFSILASTCMGELQTIWHTCKIHVGHDALANLT